MVTKVVTEHDVDNVTIIINGENKLQAKIPTTSNEVVIEEVLNVTPANVVVTLNGTDRRIVKLGKISGTEWLVFQLDAPPPPKLYIQKTISVEFYDDVGTDSGDGMTFYHTGKVRVTTEDGSPFSPNGSSAYNAFSDTDLRAVLQSNTPYEQSVSPVINFNTMTYSFEVTYPETQTSSTFGSVSSLSVYFSAEHEDAIYDYQITEVSRGADTPSQPEPEQPPVTDTDWSFITYCEQDESKEPVYENTFTGAELTGTLPDGVTAVHLVLENGEELQFPVRTDRTYKYNIDPNGHMRSGRYVKTVKLITPQGELTKSVASTTHCIFVSSPE